MLSAEDSRKWLDEENFNEKMNRISNYGFYDKYNCIYIIMYSFVILATLTLCYRYAKPMLFLFVWLDSVLVYCIYSLFFKNNEYKVACEKFGKETVKQWIKEYQHQKYINKKTAEKEYYQNLIPDDFKLVANKYLNNKNL
jgi:hypothetical protein